MSEYNLVSLGCVTLRSQALRLIYFRGERYHPERFDEIIFVYKNHLVGTTYIIIKNTLYGPRNMWSYVLKRMYNERRGIFYLVILTRWSNKSVLTYFWLYPPSSPIKCQIGRNVHTIYLCSDDNVFRSHIPITYVCGTSKQC